MSQLISLSWNNAYTQDFTNLNFELQLAPLKFYEYIKKKIKASSN